jgi:hypothetical protein
MPAEQLRSVPGIKDVNYIPGQHGSGGCGLHTRMSEK